MELEAMQRDPVVYVRDKVSHPDHATIRLDVWYKVESVTNGRAGSMRKAPKRGPVSGVNRDQTVRVLRHARVSLGSGCTHGSSLHPVPPYSRNIRVTKTLVHTDFLSLFRGHG